MCHLRIWCLLADREATLFLRASDECPMGGEAMSAAPSASDRLGPHIPGWLTSFVGRQEELAQLVGASRETVNKALAEFVQRGWIRLENRAVVILDLQRLRQRSR